MIKNIEIDIEAYNKNGFLLINNFFEKEMLEKFNITCIEFLTKSLKDFNIKTNDVLHDGFIQLDKLNHQSIHNFYNLIKNSNILQEFKNSKKVYTVVQRLLNMSNNQLIYNMYGVSRMDPPNDNRFLYKWHQESYYSIPNSQSVQLWAPLVDKSSDINGTIDVLIGSHLEELPHYIEKVPNGHEQKFIMDKDIKKRYKLLKVEINPGDALFFHPYLIHKSNNNCGDRVRYSLVSHYINPYSVNFDFDYNDSLFAQYHKKRCVNYQNYTQGDHNNI